ncbi:MFS transporter [uncultured Helicobacter sp.]|uniref:MFS transporter n=1 Tax=uncultured Helicobacter sp. TaxID=175537 RepID=UPI00374EBDBA
MSAYNALAWLNFFIADVRDGLGPYLGVFLKNYHFSEGQIGLIGTITSLCALLFGVPLGILVDKTPYKRTLIAFCICAISGSVLLNFLYPTFLFTLIAQLAIALCGVFLAPAFAAITLGIVGREQYALQTSKNEAYKHAGTAFSAGLSLVCAWYYGITSIFIITILMGVFSLLCLALLRNVSINHALARGDEETIVTMFKPKSLKRSFMDKRIMALSFAMFCFHLSNAAMLPLLSQRAHTLGIDSSGAYAAATIIIAQSTMILIALVCGKLIVNPLGDSHRDLHDDSNSKLSKTLFALMAISLLGLCVRAMIAANYEGLGGMVATQILDGVGAGITGVIVPILVAIVLRGSGHINAGFSFVMTWGGIGGALSGSLGGFVAQYFGYFYAYIALGSAALLGLIVWSFSWVVFRHLAQVHF